MLDDARAAGDSAAMVYGYIPSKMAEELKQAIAGYYAATTTMHTKGTPAARGQRGARRWRPSSSSQSGRATPSSTSAEQNPGLPRRRRSVGGTLLRPKIQDAATLCLDRLYRCSIRPTPPTGTRSSTGPTRVTAMPWMRSATRATRKTTRSARRSSTTSAAARREPRFASSSASALRLAAGRDRRRPDRAATPGGCRRIGPEPVAGQAGPEEHRRRRVPVRDGHPDDARTDRAAQGVEEDRPEHQAEPGIAPCRRIPQPHEQAGRASRGRCRRSQAPGH